MIGYNEIMIMRKIFINIKNWISTKNKNIINNLLLLFDKKAYYPYDEIHVAKYK